MAGRNYLHTALSVDSTFSSTYLNLGDLEAAANNWSGAVPWYEGSVRHAPASIRARSSLGLAYARTQRWTAAIEENLKVLELQSGNASALRNLVLLYEALGQCEPALEYAKIGQASHPTDTTFSRLEARLNLACGIQP